MSTKNINLDSGFVEMTVLLSAKKFAGYPPSTLASAVFNQLHTLFEWLGVVCVEQTDSHRIVRLIHEHGSRMWKISR